MNVNCGRKAMHEVKAKAAGEQETSDTECGIQYSLMSSKIIITGAFPEPQPHPGPELPLSLLHFPLHNIYSFVHLTIIPTPKINVVLAIFTSI